MRLENGAYHIDTPWLDAPFVAPTSARAAGSLAVDLVEAFLADNASMLSLHCAAAEIGGRLVVFPSRSHAGKSTLVGRLAASGWPVFTDDVLPIAGVHGEEGLSLGMAPRLRLPLPPRASARFRAFVDANGVLRDNAYVYLRLPEPLAPRLGRTARLGAVVRLDRSAEGPAVLEPAGKGDGLQDLIAQTLTGTFAAADRVRRLHRLVGKLPCLTLRYADIDDAVALLGRRFADWDAVDRIATDDNVLTEQADRAARPARGARVGLRYMRAADVSVHRLPDGIFLVTAVGEHVYRLNAIAAGLWNLLAVPTAVDDAIDTLHGAFPDLARARIAGDIDALFQDLAAHGLVRLEEDAGGVALRGSPPIDLVQNKRPV